jgi:hypothetical protein
MPSNVEFLLGISMDITAVILLIVLLARLWRRR